jgi:hypothetical protein
MLLYSDPEGTVPDIQKLPGHVVIVCGSGIDVRMAFEAKVALELMGGYATIMRDVSPTKLHELVQRRQTFMAADAVVVCCSEQPALAGIILSFVDVPVISIPGYDRPDPTLAVAASGVLPVRAQVQHLLERSLMCFSGCAGACSVAPGDGVSAASAAARTLHVAAQYIQHRKDRETATTVQQEPLQEVDEDKHLDRQPVDATRHGSQSPLLKSTMAHSAANSKRAA